MAEIMRSSVYAFKEETTDGTLITPVAADFTAIRDDTSLTGALDTITSNELINDIGATEPAVAKETPTGSISKMFKHSGVEGTAPDYSVLMKSSMGTQTDNTTERDLVAGSTVSVVNVDAGEGVGFVEGRAMLFKDGTNGFQVRNVRSVATDALTLNYDLSGAPASGVNTGKAIHFSPAATGHVSFSTHHHQAASASSAFYEAIAGCRTSNMTVAATANDFFGVTFDIAGTKFFYNPIFIDATNDDIDFTDDGGIIVASVTQKVYRTPIELASELQTVMQASADASGGDDVLVSYSNTDGKYTISTLTGTVLSLLWDTGTNTATTIGGALGFTVSADDTGATTYTSDNAISFAPSVTPAFDSVSNIVVKNSELLIGDSTSITCRAASDVGFTIATDVQDEDDICAESGVSSKVISSRVATFTATLTLSKFDADLFDKHINNTTTQLMFNTGNKNSSGDWTAGTVVNLWFPNAKITSHPIQENNTFAVIAIEASGFVSSTFKDVHLNFL